MELTIKIPDTIHIHNTYVCPPPPKASYKNSNKILWDLKEKYVEDSYRSLEEIIYTVCNYDDVRILVKRLYMNNGLKRLYLLTKNDNVWLRSYLDLNLTDEETIYYDISL